MKKLGRWKHGFKAWRRKSATIIVLQPSAKSWHQYLDDPILFDTIIDRLSGTAHKI
ncbi:hypothetical protein [Lentimicrobium saccharophilum]|uniref:hypothetical protein n=1 Tax=Lentimicrobium saccharophilum TaxID=1678841 RepID=UPI0012B67302|nr:hypothetical protein [Lentimicrobium saccharophilum]